MHKSNVCLNSHLIFIFFCFINDHTDFFKEKKDILRLPQFDLFILVNFIYLDGNNRNMMYYTLTKIKCILIRVNFALLSYEITIFKITTKLF